MELILEIQEFLREPVLESGGVTLPGCSLSEPDRPSRVGRLAGIFCAGVDVAGAGVAVEGAGDGVGCSWTADVTDSGVLRSLWVLLEGRPPCDDVLGRASLGRPGDDGAYWRW